MGVDCPESTRVRQRSFVGALNWSGNGAVLVLAIPASDRKKVALLRVSAKPMFAAMVRCARTDKYCGMESIVVVLERMDTHTVRFAQSSRRSSPEYSCGRPY